MGRQRIDLTGQRFGKVTVLEYAGWSTAQKASMWLVKCDCGGREWLARTAHLRRGQIQSCHSEECSGWTGRKHGHAGDYRKGTRSPEYVVWCNMKARCLNQDHPQYPDYGGRGITIFPRWADSFEAFLDDVGPRPVHLLPEASRRSFYSVDRINNDGNYEPGNVRWATPTQQRGNQRKAARG